MERPEIQAKVIATLATVLKISKEQISPTSTLEELGADSLNRVEFVLGLEDAFNVEISDDAAEHFGRVNEVVDYLASEIK